MNATELTALITALGALLGVATGYLAKAQEAKRASRLQEGLNAIEGYDKLTRALQTRLEIVEQKLFAAEKRICELEAENALLRDQVGTLKLSLAGDSGPN